MTRKNEFGWSRVDCVRARKVSTDTNSQITITNSQILKTDWTRGSRQWNGGNEREDINRGHLTYFLGKPNYPLKSVTLEVAGNWDENLSFVAFDIQAWFRFLFACQNFNLANEILFLQDLDNPTCWLYRCDRFHRQLLPQVIMSELYPW